MPRKARNSIILLVVVIILVSLACASLQPTNIPEPMTTMTVSPTVTQTPKPSETPRPTKTPDLTATQHSEELNTEVRTYYEKEYLTTTEGDFKEMDDFDEECAQLGSYCSWLLDDTASDFYMRAHFKWSSAYRSADISGCGFVFAVQDNETRDQYAVFLDRSQIYFVVTNYWYRPFKPTRGTGRVKFDNPADHPAEADFALIVKDITAYVLVDHELVGEYTLSQTKSLEGQLGVAILSGTNKDYGTRCEMTDLHYWIPAK